MSHGLDCGSLASPPNPSRTSPFEIYVPTLFQERNQSRLNQQYHIVEGYDRYLYAHPGNYLSKEYHRYNHAPSRQLTTSHRTRFVTTKNKLAIFTTCILVLVLDRYHVKKHLVLDQSTIQYTVTTYKALVVCLLGLGTGF